MEILPELDTARFQVLAGCEHLVRVRCCDVGRYLAAVGAHLGGWAGPLRRAVEGLVCDARVLAPPEVDDLAVLRWMHDRGVVMLAAAIMAGNADDAADAAMMLFGIELVIGYGDLGGPI